MRTACFYCSQNSNAVAWKHHEWLFPACTLFWNVTVVDYRKPLHGDVMSSRAAESLQTQMSLCSWWLVIVDWTQTAQSNYTEDEAQPRCQSSTCLIYCTVYHPLQHWKCWYVWITFSHRSRGSSDHFFGKMLPLWFPHKSTDFAPNNTTISVFWKAHNELRINNNTAIGKPLFFLGPSFRILFYWADLSRWNRAVLWNKASTGWID